MKFDVIFWDPVCTKPYSYDTFETEPLGGTEGATIRLAEGLARAGRKVGVIQHFDFIPSTSPAGVRYLPERWLSIVKPVNVIHLRGIGIIPHFHGKSKQFVWFHDLGQPFLPQWDAIIEKYPATLITVSDWHRENLKANGLTYPTKRIYCPIDEKCVNYPKPEKIDPYQLVWLSSPHKGLPEAVSTFYKLRERDPRFKLVIFNPGYFSLQMDNPQGCVLVKDATRETLRRVTASSLCLFYPTQFQETYGSVAAEAEALGTPVATYRVAALAESVGMSPFCNSEEDLIVTVIKWNSERPVVSVNPAFLLENVLKEWDTVLDA